MNIVNIADIESKVQKVKRTALDMCVSAGLGHLTTAYSCAEILAVLYYAVMRHNPKKPDWEDRDYFIMSKNHGSLMLYPILADLGYFSEEELMTFMKNGTRLGGHSKLTVEGVDFAGGSLGIGFGVGAGIAYAAKMDGKNRQIYVLIGDGECYEGSIWETAMFAAHNNLSNLIAIIDRNGLCVTDFTENILRLEPMAEKWKAFGWDVQEVNGHSINELYTTLSNNINTEKPLVIIANTIKGNGIDFISNKPLWHGIAPSGDDINKAYESFNQVKQ